MQGFLNMVMQEELAPIRERRHMWEKRIPEVIEILRRGTDKAIELSNKTLDDVKRAMAINYFEDDSFEKEQVAKY